GVDAQAQEIERDDHAEPAAYGVEHALGVVPAQPIERDGQADRAADEHREVEQVAREVTLGLVVRHFDSAGGGPSCGVTAGSCSSLTVHAPATRCASWPPRVAISTRPPRSAAIATTGEASAGSAALVTAPPLTVTSSCSVAA